MEEKKLNQAESLELITRMINQTKRHLHIGQGNLLLVWGYVSVIVSIAVGVSLYLTNGNPACNWLWFLIWIVGGIATVVISKREKKQVDKAPVTYVDRLTSNLWCTIGLTFGVATIMSFIFNFCGYDTWRIMFIFAFLLIGIAVSIQGSIFRENSMIFGGAVSIVVGIFITCCILAGITLKVLWAIPLFALCFIFALIIPGHVLNAKAKKQCSKN